MSKTAINYALRMFIACFFLVAFAAHADLLEEIQERGTLRIGVSLFAPWTIQDESGGLSGFEIDVGNKLAADMGIKAEFKPYAWKDIIPAVRKGEIDVIAAGMAITPERALKIDFSRPYADDGVALATNTEKTRHITRFEEINQQDIMVAVVAKTVSSDLASRLFDKCQIQLFDTAEEAQQALLNGEAHVYLASMPQPRYLALAHPDKVDLPLDRPVLPYKVGFGVKKGEQEWLNFLDAWVTAHQADQWLSATHKHWFRSLAWQDGRQK